jgi:tRNA A37 N6-isopentenylltransferase MiaA
MIAKGDGRQTIWQISSDVRFSLFRQTRNSIIAKTRCTAKRQKSWCSNVRSDRETITSKTVEEFPKISVQFKFLQKSHDFFMLFRSDAR